MRYMSAQSVRLSVVLFLVMYIIYTPFCTADNDFTRSFLDGIKYYQEGKFDESIAEFRKITDSGIRNGNLYYNLGNAYFKVNDLGNAVLWYERALKLMPDDPDLKFNYNYSLSFARDEKGVKVSPVLRVLFFWRYIIGVEQAVWICIGLNILLWCMLSVNVMIKKKKFNAPVYIIMFLLVIFSATALYEYYEQTVVKEAVILPSEVSVRAGLTDDSTELFVLHAGTKIVIDKEKDGFYRIYYADGKIGWLNKSSVGLI